MLISYPTPQLAAEHLRRIDAAHQLAGRGSSGISEIGGSGTFFDKRTGPIIAIASGGISDSDAKALLGCVNYEANVTWNTASENSEVQRVVFARSEHRRAMRDSRRTGHCCWRRLRRSSHFGEAVLSRQGL